MFKTRAKTAFDFDFDVDFNIKTAFIRLGRAGPVRGRVPSILLLFDFFDFDFLLFSSITTISYMSGMVGDQANSGDDYDSIKRVICILIMGDVLMPEDSAYHHRYTMYDPETQSEFTDLLEVHVLELPKLPAEDDGSDLWGWMKFIDVEDRKELDMIAEKDPAIGKAAARLLEISNDPETRLRIEFDRRWEADQRVERRAAVREGEEMGMEKGMEMGIERGREEGMKEERAMLIELIEKGLSLEDIKRVLTGQQEGEG